MQKTIRHELASKIEDIIWANIYVHDDSGLHLGDAIEEIMKLLEPLIPD